MLVGIALLIIACATPAFADITCGATSICKINLTSTNVQQLQGVVVTVTIDNTGANTVLSFQVTSNPLSNAPIGMDQVGWNYGSNDPAAYVSTSSMNFDGYQAVNVFKNGSCSSMDGFGKFCIQGQSPANVGGFSNAVVFTLAGKVTVFSGNGSSGGGNEFAVHIRYGNSCSGFVGGTLGTQSNVSDPNCVPAPPAPTPEPGGALLLGTGLFGFLAVGSKRCSGRRLNRAQTEAASC